MPSPLDFLTSPMVPKSAIKPAQDLIDDPAGDYGPWEARGRGFAAGSLEGLRSLSSPLNVASYVLPELGSLKGLGRGAGMAEKGLSALPEALQGVADSWQAPKLTQAAGEAVRPFNPKPGGVLYEVLERAGLKAGSGEVPTPGEARLLQQFTPKPR